MSFTDQNGLEHFPVNQGTVRFTQAYGPRLYPVDGQMYNIEKNSTVSYKVQGNKLTQTIVTVTKSTPNIRDHNANDITSSLKRKTPIEAMASGVIKKVVLGDKTFGNNMEVQQDNGRYAQYSHLNILTMKSMFVDTNFSALARVKEGEVLGYMGNTGVHSGGVDPNAGIHLDARLYTDSTKTEALDLEDYYTDKPENLPTDPDVKENPDGTHENVTPPDETTSTEETSMSNRIIHPIEEL